MQVLRATEVFKNIRNIDNAEFEESGNIVLDFSNIENIDLKAITTLLNIHSTQNQRMIVAPCKIVVLSLRMNPCNFLVPKIKIQY